MTGDVRGDEDHDEPDEDEPEERCADDVTGPRFHVVIVAADGEAIGRKWQGPVAAYDGALQPGRPAHQAVGEVGDHSRRSRFRRPSVPCPQARNGL
jgi:hypothetical protein